MSDFKRELDFYDRHKQLLNDNGINTPLLQAHILSQLQHESDLKPISENLNYSAKRLLEIFKSDFDVNRDKWLSPQEKEKVNSLIGSPEKIANFVYANQNGNGNEASGHGWLYRGRGFIQTTGLENYKKLSKSYNIDFVKNPDLLLQEKYAMMAAIFFWGSNGLNKFARLDDILTVTKRINGGLNGLEHRKECLIKWKKILGI